MGELRNILKDLYANTKGLGENALMLGTSAIAEPVAGYAAMFDPVNGAQAIREGMTYQPRTEAGRMYQQGAAQAVGKAVKPVMPVVDTWQQGVDIAGRYSPTLGALMQTAPTALGVALGAKPTLQAGRQASNTLGAMQARMIANANAPRTLNTGFMGQRGSVGIQRPLTEFEQAHLIAQQNAALPVSQGGLGLAPDNTAMDRARAMGFDAEAYHGTNTIFDGFNASGWSSTSPSYADNIASRKAMLQGGNEVNIPLLVNNENAMRVNSQRAPLSIVDEAKNSGYSGVVGDGFYVNSPKDIRSRFAAFDPFNRDSSNLLAQSAKLAPAATLGAYMANEKRKEKRN